VTITTAVAHHRQTTISPTFPWRMSNSLTLPGFPDGWPLCIKAHLSRYLGNINPSLNDVTSPYLGNINPSLNDVGTFCDGRPRWLQYHSYDTMWDSIELLHRGVDWWHAGCMLPAVMTTRPNRAETLVRNYFAKQLLTESTNYNVCVSINQ